MFAVFFKPQPEEAVYTPLGLADGIVKARQIAEKHYRTVFRKYTTIKWEEFTGMETCDLTRAKGAIKGFSGTWHIQIVVPVE